MPESVLQIFYRTFRRLLFPFESNPWISSTDMKEKKVSKRFKFYSHLLRKKCQNARIRSYSGPYSVQMRENTGQNNSEYGHFSRSEYFLHFLRNFTMP